ncbi:hypothetical protein [Aliarcobacter skirrowii]|uniref:Uncharacterized protein n=1 Tax=Aliarcobacter skirrowii TaxID=28200 RepID=A0AAW9D758_9BACT|nr:hypothetical protein [Aliarcobacter skirrowii]MDX4068110.1 hypothetical protein [Aliarcobacter skirrowii]
MNSLNLFFNHYSFLEIEEEECKSLLSLLIKAIEALDNKLDFQYDFYIEVEKLLDFKVYDGITLETVLDNLDEDLEHFFLDFLTRSNNIENLFSIDKYLELLPDYDVYLDGDGSGEQYYLLSLSYSLNGYLLSLARNIWDKPLVNVGRFNKDQTSERIDLNNISNENHSNGLVEVIQEKEKYLIFNQLPQDKMFYTDAFKKWFFKRTEGDIEKIIAKMNFAMKHKIDRRNGCIGKIDSAEISNLYEVVVGDSNENDRAKIRVFFKDYNHITNVIYGFIKCREEGMTYQEAGHIKNTEEIIKKEKLFD